MYRKSASLVHSIRAGHARRELVGNDIIFDIIFDIILLACVAPSHVPLRDLVGNEIIFLCRRSRSESIQHISS